MSRDHQFEYVRERYGKNVGRGTRVQVLENGVPRFGIVTGADRYIHVQIDGQGFSEPWHPDDVEVTE